MANSDSVLVSTLSHLYPDATLHQDGVTLKEWVEAVMAYLNGNHYTINIPMDVQGTPFQQQVWEALRTIPYGETRSYRDIAEWLGRPAATRAVANACGANPVALVIPCHRVVRSDGSLGGYGAGLERKQALLDMEARTHPHTEQVPV
jgi:AraC family transcriptional regulator of adaptative response/methylated-DNA-[protein]-cysteine methyltransferase